MTPQAPESNWIQRLWTPVIQASRAAVSAHYAAPWNRSQGQRASHDGRAV